MTKEELEQKINNLMNSTKEALQLIYDTLNHGQQIQLIKNEEVKKLFDRYGVKYTE